jgi:predicted amidohydrolase YtcJ
MDPTMPVAQALAVKNGRIVEVGGSDEILWLREADYEVIDLDGLTIAPGFVDPHNHFSIGAFETLWADCRGARDVETIQSVMTKAAEAAPPQLWIRGFGYDHADLPGHLHPTRHHLDAAVPDRPALLMHFSHHQAVVNSRALMEAGITRSTPDPPGGEIARDRAGEPTGLLFERAMSLVEHRSREGWQEQFVDVARAASARYAALGITSIQDAAVSPAVSRHYARAREAGALGIDVSEIMVGTQGWFDPPRDASTAGPLKIFVDGGYRCALRLQRDGKSHSTGFLFYERDELSALLLDTWRSGRSAVCHAIGNAGIETAVGAIEDALAREPSGRGRVRVDHAMFLTDELIARLADLQIWVVAQPSFLYDSGGISPSPEIRLRPFATVARAGVRQAFSSDFPCGSNAPLLGISAAVTRRSRRGDVFDREEAMPAHAALQAYTIDAARAAGTDRECGSLEVGKRADFLVLSRNPIECRTEEIALILVLQTWVGGVRIFNRP